MRFVLTAFLASCALASVVFALRSEGRGADALGVPSQLPFHQRLPVVARDGTGNVVASDLAAGESRWSVRGTATYRISISFEKYPLVEKYTAYYVKGVIGDIHQECTLGGQPTPCPALNGDRYRVSTLFATVREQAALANGAGPGIGAPFVEASYDGYFGYPVRIQYGLRGIEDQITIVIVEDLALLDW